MNKSDVLRDSVDGGFTELFRVKTCSGRMRWSQRVPPCSSWAISQHSFWEPIPTVASEAVSQSTAQSSLSLLAVGASGARGGGKKRTANEGERMFSRGFLPTRPCRASMIALREL